MKLIRIAAIAFLISLKASAHPGPGSLSIKPAGFGLFQTIGKMALERYVSTKLPRVSSLDEEAKYDFFAGDAQASVAIILHEFVSGTGPDVRYFDERYAFVQQMMQGPALPYLCHELNNVPVEEGARVHLRYQFSPLPAHPVTWRFAVVQHTKTLKSRNLSQLMLGSFFADFVFQSDSSVRVHIWNITSRKSYFLRIGERVQRPKLFGNVTQRISFTLSATQWQELGREPGLKGKKNPAWSGKISY